jgi:signal transduction histidine kinase
MIRHVMHCNLPTVTSSHIPACFLARDSLLCCGSYVDAINMTSARLSPATITCLADPRCYSTTSPLSACHAVRILGIVRMYLCRNLLVTHCGPSRAIAAYTTVRTRFAVFIVRLVFVGREPKGMELPIITSAAGTTSTLTPYILLSLLPSIIAAELALYGWHRRQFNAALPFILLMTAVCFWSICHTLSMASATFAPTLFWAQLQYGGIVLVAPLWLLFALTYQGTETPIKPVQRYALLAPALVSYGIVLTNGLHHLWWPTVALDLSRPFGSLQITRGILFWLHLAYSYGCIGLGLLVILHRMRTSAPFQRRQAQLVALGALFPIVGNLAHLLGFRTTVIDDPTPFLFVGTGLVIVYAALHYQFPDPTPVATDTIRAQFPDGVVVLDHAGIVTALTAPVPHMLNLAQESRTWIGHTLQHSIVGSPLEPELQRMLAAPDGNRTQRIVSHSEEDRRAIEVQLHPLHAEATRVGALLLVRDWSQQRKQRDEQDQEAHQSMLSFLAATTHELRTPLTALLGFTDLLDRGVYGELPARAHESLHAMRRNGQTMLQLINEVLDVAKLRAGQFTIECSPVDITDIIRDVVRTMEPLIQEHGLVVKLDLAPDVPHIYGQRERLAQVLRNLLANAIKFTCQGSIMVRTVHEGQRVRFSVIDTGVGIAPEEQQAIFEEFKQLNPHGHSVGTGLGLPISLRLIELMGGTLTVESTPGVGSIFTGDVPIAQEQLQAKAHGAPLHER